MYTGHWVKPPPPGIGTSLTGQKCVPSASLTTTVGVPSGQRPVHVSHGRQGKVAEYCPCHSTAAAPSMKRTSPSGYFAGSWENITPSGVLPTMPCAAWAFEIGVLTKYTGTW